jgi:UDP-glucose:(heptosyl)LPS alpha-1,3-glucosyltransferase
VGLVVEHFDPRRGGAEQWTCRFARWLVHLRHEVHVVARSFAAGTIDGIETHEVPGARTRLRFAARAERLLRGLALDVVHDMGCGWYCDVLHPHGGSRTAAAGQNVLCAAGWLRPLKRHCTGWLPRYREYSRLVRRQYGNSERLYVAVSQMVARDLQRYHAVPRGRIRVVYNGVDIERFSPANRTAMRQEMRRRLGVGDDELLLAIVAHNFRLKGVPASIRTVDRLAREGCPVRLAVAGGKAGSGLGAGQGAAGDGSRVTFLGPLADPRPLYAAADAYLHPTYYDPCSLVVLEALACGLPVVTSVFNGAAELMTEGKEGFIVSDPADDRLLADCVQQLFDGAMRTRVAQAARRLACRHTLARNAREILGVYAEIRRQRRVA